MNKHLVEELVEYLKQGLGDRKSSRLVGVRLDVLNLIAVVVERGYSEQGIGL